VDTLLHVGLGNALAATALALAVAALTRVFRSRPALTRGLWLLVLLKLLTPPLLSPRVAWPAAFAPTAPPAVSLAPPGGALRVAPAPPTPEADLDEEPAPLPVAAGLPDAPAREPDVAAADVPAEEAAVAPRSRLPSGEAARPVVPVPSWGQVVLACWLGGSVLWFGVAGVRLYRFGRALRHARPAPPALEEEARRLARRLGLARCPRVLLVAGQVPPLLWAVLGPACVLLPAVLWDRLSAEQRQTLLAHELAHLRRRDHWARWLEFAALGLYWWHPVAWWARREIQEAEELCCDAWVVAALPGAARDYARALLAAVAFISDTRSALPMGASGIGRVPLLKRRLAMILEEKTPKGLSRAGLLAVLGLGVVLLPLLPSWGLTQPPPTDSDTAAAPPAQEPGRVAPARVPAAVPATTAPARVAAEPASAARVPSVTAAAPAPAEDARDEVELLKAQLDAKKAEVEETQALLGQARHQLKRQEELAKRGTVGEDVLEDARTQVAVQEARLRAKEAQLREAMVRLKQAERQTDRPQPALSAVPPPAAPRPRFETRTQPAPAGPTPPAVDVPATTPVPAADPNLPQPAASVGRPGPDVERRLQDLEKKLDGLLREVEALRREMAPARPGKPGSRVPGAGP
jgi:beta-lactamase regulating signal transducer with metallopeptidase domain